MPRSPAKLKRRRQRATLLCILAFFSLSSSGIFAPLPHAHAANDNRATKIKAAVFYYVLKFVEWGPSIKAGGSILRVCMTAHDDLITEVRNLVKGKSIQGMQLVLEEVPWAKGTNELEKGGCSVLYVPSDLLETNAIDTLRQIEKEGKVLTICEVRQLHQTECMIQIFEESNKARIAVNRSLVGRTTLKISSELLELAVDPTNYPAAR